MSANPTTPLTRTGPGNDSALPQLALISPRDSARSMVEAYIAAKFQDCYGASIQHFLPRLIAAQQDGIKAALGVRSACETLFLEQYLDAPIEAMLEDPAIPRNRIAEIGNLVSCSRHHTLTLFMSTACMLYEAGFSELVFCATRSVAAIIRQTGAAPSQIVRADGSRLGVSLPQWGRYYDTEPVVMHLKLGAVVALINDAPLLRRYCAPHRAAIAVMAKELMLDRL